MKNHNHNLVQLLHHKLDSAWRYDQYAKDAQEGGCERCSTLISRLKGEDEGQVKALRDEIAQHVQDGTFD